MFQTLAPIDELEAAGIGLAVVKKTVELYEGQICVESHIGPGSNFYFTLSKAALTSPKTYSDSWTQQIEHATLGSPKPIQLSRVL